MEFKITSISNESICSEFWAHDVSRVRVHATVSGGSDRVTRVSILVKEQDITNEKKLKKTFLKGYKEALKVSYEWDKRMAERKKQEELWLSMVNKVIDP